MDILLCKWDWDIVSKFKLIVKLKKKSLVFYVSIRHNWFFLEVYSLVFIWIATTKFKLIIFNKNTSIEKC